MTSVLIVVLNWNGIDDTKKCLDSLLTQTYKNFGILVVDNHSSDNSLTILRKIEKKHSKLTVLANPTNTGFAGGVNTGIRYALERSFDAVALFNNDAVADKNWLKELVTVISPKNVGIATGLLLDADGKTIDSSGEFYSTWGLAYPRGREHGVETAPQAGDVFGGTGGATLYKTNVFKGIGLFDEDFFMYFEDVDVSFRAQLAGWRVVYTPKAIAYHKRGVSTKKIPGLALQKNFSNLPQVFVKNVPRGLLWHIGSRFYFSYVLFLGNAIARGQGGPALKGLLRSIALTPSSLIKRRRIQKSKKVTSDHIRKVLWNDLPPDQLGMRALRKKFTGKE